MNSLVILPLIIPLITGLILIIFRSSLPFQRAASAAATLSTFVISVWLLFEIRADGILALQLGGWEAPFGITFVADLFAVLLLVAASFVSFVCLLYAFRSIGEERERNFFYPLFLFLVTGVYGSFLTGDIFNLFVCFELMLISSYALLTLGGEKRQLRESLKYVTINVISSFFFLVAVAYLYSILGTLNMAHLSERVAEAGQDGLITTVALLLLMVFSLKAGLVLFYWLPGSYSAAPTAISALFAALLTKVGIYGIIRMFTLVFYHETSITHLIIGIMAAITMILGAFGAVASNQIRSIIVYNVVVAVGFILSGMAAFNITAMTGSIYYLIHDIIVKMLIFLLAGTVILIAGTDKLKEISGLIRSHPFLGWMFFVGALSLSGIPPLSGFLGKVFITKGLLEAEMYWIGAIGLATSLLVLYSMMKIFMNAFWGETNLSPEEEKGSTKGLLFPLFLLTAATVALGLGAEGIQGFVEPAAEVLMDPSIYIEAVLGGDPSP